MYVYELLTLVDGCGEVFASHTIGEESLCLIAELDKTDIINHIKIHLYDWTT